MAEALPPGSTIGILGGGQLGRMLALAAARLGLKMHIYTDEPNAPPAPRSPPAPPSAPSRTRLRFPPSPQASMWSLANSRTCRPHALEAAATRAPVFPPAKSFAIAQDRLVEKDFLRGLGIPVAPYADGG